MLQISSHTRFKFMILSQKGKSKEMLFRNIFLILHTSELLSSKTNSQLSCYLSFCLGYLFLDKKGDKHAYIQSNGVAVQIFGVTTLPLEAETTVPKNKRNLRVAQKITSISLTQSILLLSLDMPNACTCCKAAPIPL